MIIIQRAVDVKINSHVTDTRGTPLARREFLSIAAAALAASCGSNGATGAVTATVFNGVASGVVIDLSGTPQPGLGLLILMDDSGQQTGLRAAPDGQGRFTFTGLKPGNFQVRFEAPHQAIIPDPFDNPVRFTVTAGQTTNVPVHIQRGDYTQNLVEIYLGDYFFQRQPDGALNGDVVVPVGTNVCWYNVGTHVHSVTGGPWGDSGDLQKSEAFFWTATQPGTFGYRCKYHSQQMQGILRVTA
jgi:hypothetical protein